MQIPIAKTLSVLAILSIFGVIAGIPQQHFHSSQYQCMSRMKTQQ